MSDRHLYKAKRTDNQKWVEGNLAWSDDADNEYRAVIIPKIDSNMFFNSNSGDLGFENWHLVNLETLCQYTGLTDQNGKKIWENDVCIIHSSSIDEEDGNFHIKWDDDEAKFVLSGDSLIFDFDSYYGNECEVIGNIFDNPELLGGNIG